MHDELIRRMEDFLSCRLAERQPGGRLLQLYERPSITISREAGTDGRQIAQELVDYLTEFDETAEHGWALFDQSLIARVIERLKIPEIVRDYLAPVENPAPAHEVVDAMHGTPPTEWTLFHHTAHTIRNLCRLGNTIVIGRGGNYLTQDISNTFHVRLVAGRNDRIAATARSLELSKEDAQSYVDATDQARKAYVQRNLDRPIEDPAAYHMTINVSRLNHHTAARVIGDALIEWAGSRVTPFSA